MNIRKFIEKIGPLKKIAKKSYLKKRQKLYNKFSDSAETDKKLVVFEAYQGRNYSCSPKAIYEYMSSSPDYSDYKFIWVFRDVHSHGSFAANTQIVEFDSKDALKAYACAGTWITNSRLRDFMVPRSDQQYVQCWHGTPFKKIGCDIEAGGNATSTVNEIHEEYMNEASRMTKMISPSAFCTTKLISAFGLDKISKENIIIQKGYPRNDALFCLTEEKIQGIKEKLNITDKRVILYCPTFRDNQFNEHGYTLDMKLDFDQLPACCDENTVILFRAHYFITRQFDFNIYNRKVLDVSDYDDINDLYAVSDILITDYSSVFFDFACLNKPIIFYHYDLEDYKTKMRDFYFGTAMLPGPIANTQEKLNELVQASLENINNGGNGLLRHQKTMEAFNKRFNSLNGPDCAKKVTDEIFKSGIA